MRHSATGLKNDSFRARPILQLRSGKRLRSQMELPRNGQTNSWQVPIPSICSPNVRYLQHPARSDCGTIGEEAASLPPIDPLWLVTVYRLWSELLTFRRGQWGQKARLGRVALSGIGHQRRPALACLAYVSAIPLDLISCAARRRIYTGVESD